MSIAIRIASPEDVQALTDIYNHYITETAITFDLEPKSTHERAQWLSRHRNSGPHQLFVATLDGKPIGYAGSSKFREKQAYETSVETTIYLHPNSGHRGVGSKLYSALFAALATEDVNRAYAGITLPNKASVALHRKFGFLPVGIYNEVGRKFDKYWDVQWFEKRLGGR